MIEKVSEHFSRHEVACKCGCGFMAADIELVNKLEELRAYFIDMTGEPIILYVHSWCRCESYNKKVGGAKHSQHVKGLAADTSFRFVHNHNILAVDPRTVYEYLDRKYLTSCGIGLYSDFVHFDIREKKARW